ncbi:YaaC family protein [Gluconobacter oxydans]|uniref:YaaC family protein n=2 Tax=Gluconobacter TaxID=441 RepID=UPI0039ECA80E
MLEQLISDDYRCIAASNQPMFRTDVDFDAEDRKRNDVIKEWVGLDPEQRAAFKKQADFETSKGVINLKDPAMLPARNYSLLSREAISRISSSNDLRLLPLDGLNFDESILELAESIENVEDIRSLYKLRKKTTGQSDNAGINKDEALRLKNCFTQGRELYLAGKNGSLMVKPLNFFYALTAYTYGIIVLNNPLRFSKKNLPGSHGMSYLPDTIQAQFGGDSARGTFSDLVTSFPTHLIKTSSLEFQIDCRESILDFYNRKFDVGLGMLLSMIPEMSDYYKLTTGSDSRCHSLSIVPENDPRMLRWEFQIGNGELRPTRKAVEESFPTFEIGERHGKIIVSVPAVDAHKIRACIYTDIRGGLWFIENPFFPVLLPEIAIHFLANNIFSSVMRYRPDEWGSVLLNDVSSNLSLITRHYFSSFQRKFFVIVLRSISRYTPYVA